MAERERRKALSIGLFCIGVNVIGASLPLVYFITTMVAGAGLAILWMRAKERWMPPLVMVLCFVANLAFNGSPVGTLIQMLPQLGVGFSMGFALRKNWPLHRLLVLVIGVDVLISGGTQAAMVVASTGSFSLAGMVNTYAPVFEAMEQGLISSGSTQAQASAYVSQMKDYLESLMVGYTVVSSTVFGALSLLVAKKLMWSVYHVAMPQYSLLTGFKMSRVGGCFYLGAFILLLFLENGLALTVLSNFLLILTPAFLLDGWSLVEYYLNKAGVKRGTKMLLYGAIVCTIFFPVVNGMGILATLGAMDAVWNFRKMPD